MIQIENETRKTLGSVELKVKGDKTNDADASHTTYKHWGLRVSIQAGQKIYDVHIKFSPKPSIKVFDDVLHPDGKHEDKINLVNFPGDWTGTYDPATGQVTLQGPDDPQDKSHIDIDKPLRGPSTFDFSFDFEPSTATPGQPPPGATTTVTFSSSARVDIGSGTGTL